MQDALLQQGFSLMLFGMGTVFVFLTLLVLSTFIMSFVIGKLPEEEEATPKSSTAKHSASAEVSPRTLAIIQAAIHEHRAKQA